MSDVIPEPPPGEEPHPEHPIVLPEEPPPVVEAATLNFFQRITLGFDWEPLDVDAGGTDEVVSVDAINVATGSDQWTAVRNVVNSGSSSVTYPSDFSGPVKIRVRGATGAVEGETTVT